MAICKTIRRTFRVCSRRSSAAPIWSADIAQQRKDTRVKRLTSRIANFVRSRFTKDGVRDTGCTLKAMRRECVSALVPFKGMHRFIPALVKGAGYRLVEIPVNHRPRKFGQSKYGLGNRAVRATVDMFGVRWLLSRQLNYKIATDECSWRRGTSGSRGRRQQGPRRKARGSVARRGRALRLRNRHAEREPDKREERDLFSRLGAKRRSVAHPS